MTPILTIHVSGAPVEEVELGGTIVVGRADDAQLQLEVVGVSRYHAAIEQRRDGFWILDLQSQNGTWVNGQELNGSHLLEHGDEIRLGGNVRLRFEWPNLGRGAEDGHSTTDQFDSSDTSASPRPSNVAASARNIVPPTPRIPSSLRPQAMTDAARQADRARRLPGQTMAEAERLARMPGQEATSVAASATSLGRIPGQMATSEVTRIASIPGEIGASARAVWSPRNLVRRPMGLVAIASVAVVLTVAGATWLRQPSRTSDAQLKFTSPRIGIRVTETVPVHVKLDDPASVRKLVLLVDGKSFDSIESAPFDAELDPTTLTKTLELGPGSHVLSAVVIDTNGRKIPQADTVPFELVPTETGVKSAIPTARTGPVNGDSSDPRSSSNQPAGGASPALEVRLWAGQLASQISGKGGYEFDPEFAREIERHTADYRIDFTQDVRSNRRVIVKVFGDQNAVNPLLASYLAVSQTKFGRTKGDASSGIWGIPKDVLQGSGVVGQSDEEAAATYTRSLVTLFEPEDFIYAIACYGLTPAQASDVKRKLDAAAPDASKRRDFWALVKAGVVPRDGAERVVRFFAAGVVGENPRAFGIQAEPLSTLF